jgi:hypothetical protein
MVQKQMNVSCKIIPFLLISCLFFNVKSNPSDNGNKRLPLFLESSLGLNAFSMDEFNAYYIKGYAAPKGFLRSPIEQGRSLEASGGIRLHRMLSVSLGYMVLSGKSEDSIPVLYQESDLTRAYMIDFKYCDVAMRMVKLSAMYIPFQKKWYRAEVGAAGLLGRGYAHVGYGPRPAYTMGNYADFNFKSRAFGTEFSTGGFLYPALHLALGIRAGYRLCRSTALYNISDGSVWRRPPSDPHDIFLDFSGFFASGSIGIHF